MRRKYKNHPQRSGSASYRLGAEPRVLGRYRQPWRGNKRSGSLLPCLLLLACQTGVPASAAAQGTPALAATPSTPSAAVAAAASQGPRGLPAAQIECPKAAWADSLRTQPSAGVGSVLLGALGLSVSDAPGKAPNKRLNGAPAVVVE